MKKTQIIVDYIMNGRGEISVSEAKTLKALNSLRHLVKYGKLSKVKRGTYKLKEYPKGVRKSDPYHIATTQISIF